MDFYVTQECPNCHAILEPVIEQGQATVTVPPPKVTRLKLVALPPPPKIPCIETREGPLIVPTSPSLPYENRSLPAKARVDLRNMDVRQLGSANALVRLIGGPGGCVRGGKFSMDDHPIAGEDWEFWHSHPAVRVSDTSDFLISGLHIGIAGDGFIVGVNAPNVTVEDSRFEHTGDDGWEGDHYLPGLGASGNLIVRRCLFEDSFSGISARCAKADEAIADGRGKLVDVEDVLLAIRPKKAVYKPESYPSPGNGPPFKWDTRNNGRGLPIRARRLIILMSQTSSASTGTIDLTASGYLTPDSKDNLLIYTGPDNPTIKTHPSFRVERRSDEGLWNDAVSDFLKLHPDLR